MINPLSGQGMLNRVLTHIVVPQNQQLTVTAPFMAKSLAMLTLEGPFVDQEPTATGIVNSPRPFVMGQVVINLLRSQALAVAWLAQAQAQASIGPMTVYPDSTAMAPITLDNCSITDYDPGAFDGSDPTLKVTVKGVFYTNATMWMAAADTALGAI